MTNIVRLFKTAYPAACATCQQSGSPFCDNCKLNLSWIEPPVCERCGRQTMTEWQTCQVCLAQPTLLQHVRAAVHFADPVRPAIHALKYRKLRGVAEPLADVMVTGWRKWASAVDLVIPVPLHAERFRERGYNQSEELSRWFSAEIKLPHTTDALFRTIYTRPQVGLRQTERAGNVQGAFKAVPSLVRNQKLLLIDDVLTTGSTLEAAAEALIGAGATSVSAYCLSRARDVRQHDYSSLDLANAESRAAN